MWTSCVSVVVIETHAGLHCLLSHSQEKRTRVVCKMHSLDPVVQTCVLVQRAHVGTADDGHAHPVCWKLASNASAAVSCPTTLMSKQLALSPVPPAAVACCDRCCCCRRWCAASAMFLPTPPGSCTTWPGTELPRCRSSAPVGCACAMQSVQCVQSQPTV